jgi:hypothetical protein
MDKQILLNKLSQVADSLDDKNYIKQADKVTDVMIRLSRWFWEKDPYSDYYKLIKNFEKEQIDLSVRNVVTKGVKQERIDYKQRIVADGRYETLLDAYKYLYKSTEQSVAKDFIEHMLFLFDDQVLKMYQDVANREAKPLHGKPPEGFEELHQGEAYFDNSGNLQARNVWVPPVWDKK